MTTEALGQVIRFAADQLEGTRRDGLSYEADAELKALEESHAEMVRLLRAALSAPADDVNSVHGRKMRIWLNRETAADMLAVLKKAGAFP